MIIHNGAVDDVGYRITITRRNANSAALPVISIAGYGAVDDCWSDYATVNINPAGFTAGYREAVNRRACSYVYNRRTRISLNKSCRGCACDAVR